MNKAIYNLVNLNTNKDYRCTQHSAAAVVFVLILCQESVVFVVQYFTDFVIRITSSGSVI